MRCLDGGSPPPIMGLIRRNRRVEHGGGVLVSRKTALLTTIALALVVVLTVACGGGGGNTATQAPTTPTRAAATQGPAGTPTGATATQGPAGTSTGSTYAGSATATVTVGDKTLKFEGGRCDKGPDDVWLAVNIGLPGPDNYFGLVVGATAVSPEGTRSAKGGGEFTGDALGAVIAVQGGDNFTITGGGGGKVTVDADLNSGEFEGTDAKGNQMSGSFKCS
jgi:hypothetical protein